MTSVFISYRRADTAGHAGRLAEALGERYGRENVFIDIDAISPGTDFHERIEQAVKASDVALVLIGEEWLEPSGARRRIDDAGDVVRQEVAAALGQPGLLVVPVLVENARMPASAELPEELQRLSRLNALELSNKRWRYDLGHLLEVVEQRSGRLRRVFRHVRARGGLAAVVAVLAGAAVAAAILLTRDGNDPAANRASKVAACQRTHGLSTARQQRSPQAGESQIEAPARPQESLFIQKTFASCDWPPPPGADPDGYGAVTVTTVDGPGDSTASGQDIADRIESHCNTLVLEYKYGSMGYFERVPAFRARAGEIWGPRPGRAVSFSRRSLEGLILPFYPSREEVVVLHNNRRVIDRLTCAR